MTSTAEKLWHGPMAATAALDCLGPGQVIDVMGREVRVELPEGERVHATLALAVVYEPAPGDVLLVAGKGGAYYVIGVLEGSGRTALCFPGDVEVRAEGGKLRLSGDSGVEIQGPELDVRADKLRILAGAVVQTFSSLYQRVSARLSVHAKQAHTVVEESMVTQARSAAIVTEETVTINGKAVHLG